jgi:hypothetical protein
MPIGTSFAVVTVIGDVGKGGGGGTSAVTTSKYTTPLKGAVD